MLHDESTYRNSPRFPIRTNPPSRIEGALLLAVVLFASGYLAAHIVIAIVLGWL